MGGLFAILVPVIIGINGILLIAVEIMDSVKKKKQQEITADEKERDAIRARWKNCRE